PPDSMPVYPTIASQFADAGVDNLWAGLAAMLNERHGTTFASAEAEMGSDGLPKRDVLIPPERINYLAQVTASVRDYHSRSEEVAGKVRLVQQLEAAASQMRESGSKDAAGDLEAEVANIRDEVPDEAWQDLDRFDEVAGAYNSGETSYMVGSREVQVKTTNQTIEGIDIPRVSLPDTQDWGDRLEWIRSENVPGSFPYTGGCFRSSAPTRCR
ncbi:MAG: hypothetical protein KAG07_04970, partial [Candidatus Thalassarchaeum sp.]|nr:hypothetical protein [Candidatus Thalassarchaeum sp.]